MSNKIYQLRETDDDRWGIYFEDRLLATMGNYEICQFIVEALSNNLSLTDTLKAAIAYKKALNHY